MKQTALSKKDQMELILESIPVSARMGDAWNEIQASIREMQENEEDSLDGSDEMLSEIVTKLLKFSKRH